MTLLQLRYFVTLARVLHYTRAAEELHISQPGLSYAVTELEKEVGVRLFQKNGRGMALSHDGKVFLPYALKSLQTLDRGVEVLTRAQDALRNRVSLGYVYSVSSSTVPALVQKFYERHVGSPVVFNFVQELNEALIDQVREGKLDMALCFDGDPELESVPLFEQQLFCVVAQNHRLAGRSAVIFADFADEPFVTLQEGKSSLRKQLDTMFGEQDRRPRIAFEVQECNAILQFVALGQGVAIVPWVPAFETLPIKALPMREPSMGRQVLLAWNRKKPMTSAATTVRDHILETFQPDVLPRS